MDITANPFEKDIIVSEPRQIEKAVSGLNDRPLRMLLERFEQLENKPLPMREKLPHTQFVVSPQPGYGKSHLIGRLFRKLRQRATLVYISPFSDHSTCWKALLLRTVQEMDFPDHAGGECRDENMPTQLEAFAQGILLHLLRSVLEKSNMRSENKKNIFNAFRNSTPAMIREAKKRQAWIRKNFGALKKEFHQQIRTHNIHLNASSLTWLGALFAYAFSPEFELRETCRDWLKGGTIDPDEAKEIGIRTGDIPVFDRSDAENNELFKERISDFCQLAGFFRPFVFCFDQTENYAKEIVLAKTLGTVIQVLTDQCPNQMTVMTANQHAWANSLRPFWEEAHRDRLGIPLELEAMNQDQAEELAEHRLAEWEGEEEKQAFFDRGRFPARFFRNRAEMGVRDFLKQSGIRWQVITGVSSPPPKISECYRKNIEAIRIRPKRLVFDPSAFFWLVNEAAKRISHIEVEKYETRKGYFSLRWKTDGCRVLFGFEAGSNWRRWQAIAREAELHHDARPETKAVLFRTPEQPEIPGPRWKVAPAIEQAKSTCLHIMPLKKSELATLYAAHDLHLDAGEENIPFERSEVLDFICGELSSFWKRIRKPLSEGFPTHEKENPAKVMERSETYGGSVSDELLGEIRRIVRTEKLMSLTVLMAKLPQQKEEVISEACRHIPEIKVHIGPKESMLQWQSSRSTSPN